MIRRWLARLACVLCLLCIGPVCAAEGSPDTRRLDLPSQPLSESLLALSAEFGRPILFETALTRGLQAPALQGVARLEDALTRLLADFPLRFRIAASGAVVLAAVPVAPADDEVAEAPAPAEEVLVTGSHIPRDSQKHLPRQLVRVDREEMALTGIAELGELLGRLPSTSGNQIQVHNLNQPLTAGATTWAECGGAIVRRSVWRITRCRDERIHADHECGRPRDAFDSIPEPRKQCVDSDIPPF